MKIRISVSVMLLIITATITSCQKEVDSNILKQLAEDSTYLVKEVSFDTTLPAGQDTAFISNYFYDSQKRLSGYDFTEIGGNLRFKFTYKLYYNGNDTLPYRIYRNDNNSPDSSVIYLFYSGGFIVKDSSVLYVAGIPDVITRSFLSSLGGNRYLFKQEELFSSGGGWFPSDSVIYTRTLSGGNVTASVDSTWNGSTYYYMTSEQKAYDNKNSPYNKFPIWYLGYFEHLVGEVSLTGINNMTSYSYISDSGPPFSDSYTIAYTYNADNYPVVARLSGNNDVNKAVYFYTKL